MNIQKFFLFFIITFSLNTVRANPQGALPLAPPPLVAAPTPTTPAPDDLFLEMGTDPKKEREFLGEVVQDEKKIDEMAKKFDERLKRIETSFSSICQAIHQESALGESASIQPKSPSAPMPIVPSSINPVVTSQPVPPAMPQPIAPKV